jgi:hypothetical protein
MSETNFEEKSDNFWNWLKNNGATLSDTMAIKDYRSEGAGRGIVATKAIKVHTQTLKSCFIFLTVYILGRRAFVFYP